VSDERFQKYQAMKNVFERETAFLKKNNTAKSADLKEPIRLINLLKRPNVSFDDLQNYGYKIPIDITANIKNRISLEAKYEGYIKRQFADIEKFIKMEKTKIPNNIDFMKIESIAYEAREKLAKINPTSLGQASRISGVNHTDVTALMIYLKKKKLGDK